LFSLFSSFDGGCQSGCFVIQRNRDKLSTRKFDVGAAAPALTAGTTPTAAQAEAAPETAAQQLQAALRGDP